MSTMRGRSLRHLMKHPFRITQQTATAYWRRGWAHKFVAILIVAVLLSIAIMYSIGYWYIWGERNQPFVLGASFVPSYAQSLGLDPHQTLTAMLSDLQVRHLRLVSHWDQIEPQQGTYNFSELDWEFAQAEAYHAKVTLAVGLRQPRWPECHMPRWAQGEPTGIWEGQLNAFMTAVISRYKDSPALDSYQLENEYFLRVFGLCMDYSHQRLYDEAALVRRLDPYHTLIISRSDNAIGWPVRGPTPDEFGISIYKRVWTPILGRYIQYPFPAWYYAFLAGIEKICSGKDMIIHELQAEPWPPRGWPLSVTPLAEQNKSLDATRLHQTVEFGKATGMKTIDLWGAEYWYYRKVTLHDPSVWNAAKQEYIKANR
jgi:hypothetical protein